MGVDRVATERGLAWEKRVAAFLGGDPVPQSGAGWSAKGDVVAGFLVQAKSEKNRTWGSTRRELKEAIDDAVGTGRQAALLVQDADGEEIFIARAADVVELFSSGFEFQPQESEGERRRKAADVPGLLREDS